MEIILLTLQAWQIIVSGFIDQNVYEELSFQQWEEVQLPKIITTGKQNRQKRAGSIVQPAQTIYESVYEKGRGESSERCLLF